MLETAKPISVIMFEYTVSHSEKKTMTLSHKSTNKTLKSLFCRSACVCEIIQTYPLKIKCKDMTYTLTEKIDDATFMQQSTTQFALLI